MEPRQSLIAELVLLAVELIVLVLRFWVIRQQRRGLEDWVRDIIFIAGALLCLASTSCLLWYCWESIEVYRYATVVVDQKITAQARNSTVGLTHMTATQLAALQSQNSEQRELSIELMATVMLLDPWYRRFLFFIWGAYFTELWLLKGAFLVFYWQLFSMVQSRLVYLLYGTTGFVVITYIIILTIHFTWCTPVYRNWTIPLSEFPGTSSINNLATLTIGSMLNIATDLMILILPLLIVKSFNLKRKEKYGLCFIFAMGIMCVTASVVRYYMLYLPFEYPPVTIDGVRVALLCGTLEMMTGMIAFCLPSFRMILYRAIKNTIHHKPRPIALSHVPGGNGSYCEPPNTGSSREKSKKKGLPRHPNTLLTADFLTHHTSSREDKEDPERGTIVSPPNTLKW
ncbi:hypothetical protein L211DRAFT_815638 [Terfezia boudieri ATCC MYA-4762]|uniref:Rhodopsin domain-containing protein n=1 Tax=Terfezia boudieri ATCC MYA-4762 TaxID=1051890 RepID=A0A3N4L9E0_9PEZI|nr:hypothetical protein L211DRAFT_815638 [Terfezia boudieri ATCC MYA-4762]